MPVLNPWEWLAEVTKAAPVPAPKLETRNFKAGDKVFHWTLLEYFPDADRKKNGKWMCLCSCGVQRLVQANNLARDGSKSCGHARDKGGYGREFNNAPQMAQPLARAKEKT